MKTYSLWIDGLLISVSNLPEALRFYQNLKREYALAHPKSEVLVLVE